MTMRRRTFIAGAAATFVSTQIRLPHAYAVVAYDDVVLSHNPKHYYPAISGQAWPDVIRGANGRFVNGRGTVIMPDGTTAPHFDGTKQWAWMPDSSYFGPAGARSAWTVTVWVRPTVLNYVNSRSTGYVNWIGKRGNGRDGEWLMRIYNLDSYRPQWLRAYVLSPQGGDPSAGQSYRDGFAARQWLHVAFVVSHVRREVALFVDGRQSRGWVSMDAYGTIIRNGTAPLIVGRDSQLDPNDGTPRSWFRGAVGKPAFFTYDLSAQGVSEQYPAGRISQQAEAGRPL
jgi:hypothetical protein